MSTSYRKNNSGKKRNNRNAMNEKNTFRNSDSVMHSDKKKIPPDPVVYYLSRYLMGNEVQIITEKERFEAVLKAFDDKNVCLTKVMTYNKSVNSDVKEMCEYKEVLMKDVMLIKRLPTNGKLVSASVLVDSEIAQRRPPSKITEESKNLVPYFDDDGKNESYEDLLPNATSGDAGWYPEDMLKVNEERFKVKNTFNELMEEYTTPIDQSDPQLEEKKERAAVLARQIENDAASRRLQSLEDDESKDDEARFSAVNSGPALSHPMLEIEEDSGTNATCVGVNDETVNNAENDIIQSDKIVRQDHKWNVNAPVFCPRMSSVPSSTSQSHQEEQSPAALSNTASYTAISNYQPTPSTITTMYHPQQQLQQVSNAGVPVSSISLSNFVPTNPSHQYLPGSLQAMTVVDPQGTLMSTHSQHQIAPSTPSQFNLRHPYGPGSVPPPPTLPPNVQQSQCQSQLASYHRPAAPQPAHQPPQQYMLQPSHQVQYFTNAPTSHMAAIYQHQQQQVAAAAAALQQQLAVSANSSHQNQQTPTQMLQFMIPQQTQGASSSQPPQLSHLPPSTVPTPATTEYQTSIGSNTNPQIPGSSSVSSVITAPGSSEYAPSLPMFQPHYTPFYHSSVHGNIMLTGQHPLSNCFQNQFYFSPQQSQQNNIMANFQQPQTQGGFISNGARQ